MLDEELNPSNLDPELDRVRVDLYEGCGSSAISTLRSSGRSCPVSPLMSSCRLPSSLGSYDPFLMQRVPTPLFVQSSLRRGDLPSRPLFGCARMPNKRLKLTGLLLRELPVPSPGARWLLGRLPCARGHVALSLSAIR